MRFRVSMIGLSDRPVVEFNAGDLAELAAVMDRARFITGTLVQLESDADDCAILIPVSRIQFISEA